MRLAALRTASEYLLAATVTESPELADSATARRSRSGRFASLVGAGIFISRLTGLLREQVLRALLGLDNPVAEAFSAALGMPKVLQNLMGEGTLSASFVPVYSETLGDGDAAAEEAAELRGAVFGLLVTAVVVLVLIVVATAPWLAAILLPGFEDGAKLDLTVRLSRMMAIGIGFIVLGAWCLGVLNSHRKFFLSYVAPAVWNIAIIAALAVAALGDRIDEDIAWYGAIGVAVGGALQFVIQLPTVIRTAGRLRPSLRLTASVRKVLKLFGPAVLGRGVVTLSSYIDLILASFLATGALTALFAAQTLYLLPISVFAMGVAAADLPELAREQGKVDIARERIEVGSDRILFFLLFSAVAFVSAGMLLVSALFERGSFDRSDSIVVWLVLAAFALGLAPAGLSRLLQNASYAAGDTKTPARIALVRVAVAVIVGLATMFTLDRYGISGTSLVFNDGNPGLGPLPGAIREAPNMIRIGAVGLALGGAVAAWVEYILLRRHLRTTYGSLPMRSALIRLLPGALIAGATGGMGTLLLDGVPAIPAAIVVLGIAGGLYVLAAYGRGNDTARQLLRPVLG